MKKFSLSLKSEFNITIILILVIILIFQIFSISYTNRVIERQNSSSRDSIISVLSVYLNNKLEALNRMQNIFKYEENLIKLLQKNDDNQYIGLLRDKFYDIQQYLNTDIIHSIVFPITQEYGDYIDITNNISEARRICMINENNQYNSSNIADETLTYGFFEMDEGTFHNIYIYCLSPLFYFDYDKVQNINLGTMMIALQVDMGTLYRDLGYEKSIHIQLYSERNSISLVNIGNNNDNLIYMDEMKLHNSMWKVSGSIQSASSISDLRYLILLFVIESLILFIINILFQINISKTVVSPLNQMISYFKTHSLAERFKPLTLKGNRDIISLSNDINDMLIRNKKLANTALKNQQKAFDLELLKNEAVLYALRNQVNPHFLYNLFELIRSIAVVYNINEIEVIALNTSKMLRYNLKNNEIVTVSDEVEHIEKYINIMKVRYSDTFEIKYDLTDEALNCKIIKLAFQPIIENAFMHGYRSSNKMFKILVSGYVSRDTLFIEFNDNGWGIEPEQLNKIQRELNSSSYDNHNSIGLRNLAYRLQLYYGNQYNIKIDSQKNVYTKIQLSITI